MLYTKHTVTIRRYQDQEVTFVIRDDRVGLSEPFYSAEDYQTLTNVAAAAADPAKWGPEKFAMLDGECAPVLLRNVEIQ